MREMIFALWVAVLLIVVAPAGAFACGFEPMPLNRVAREADRIVLGRVIDRVGVGLDTYTIEVERVIKGPRLPKHWVIRDAGASDCGMPRLNRGERVVLEFYRPGRITTGPWFYAWKLDPNGRVAFSDSHQPRSLTLLLTCSRATQPPVCRTRQPTRPGKRPLLLYLQSRVYWAPSPSGVVRAPPAAETLMGSVQEQVDGRSEGAGDQYDEVRGEQQQAGIEMDLDVDAHHGHEAVRVVVVRGEAARDL